MDTARISELVGAALGDMPVEISLGITLTAGEARDAIGTLAVASGFDSDALVEWCSAWADEPTSEDCPPVYYATLMPSPSPSLALDDLPLGSGATPEAALSDLLWALGTPVLCAALFADDSEFAWLDETVDAAMLAHV